MLSGACDLRRNWSDFRSSLFVLSVVLASGMSSPAFAKELPEFYRGVRAMAMGNAFTAISDDDDAVFYNPAGLAFNKRIEVNLFNPKFDFSSDDFTSIPELKDAAKGFNSGSLSKFFGKHLYADGSIFPSVYLPNFVMGYYYAGKVGIIGRNVTLPQIEATEIVDRGVISGVGFETQGLARHHFFRFGTTVKWITRQGFDGTIPFSKLVTADANYLKSLVADPASGWGIGAGIQYELPIAAADNLVFGSSWQDIGDTSFGGRLASNTPPAIRNNLAMGGAFSHRFGRGRGAEGYTFTISGEMRNMMEQNIDPLLKTHIGMELKLGDLAIQGGLNQDNFCGGVELDMLFIKIAAVTYGVETQSLAYMDRERRYMLQFTLKLDMMGQTFKSNRDLERIKHPRAFN
jgi:hypothetical protein